ncbi:GumC family protein [Thiomicrolovo sp. ZZH C-3]
MSTQNDSNAQINIPAMLKALKSAWWFIVLLAILFGGGAAVYAYFQPSIYSANGTIKLGGLRNRDSGSPLMQAISGSQDDLMSEMQILQSRYMASRVLESVDFTTRYFVKSGWKQRELYKNVPFIVTHSYLNPRIKGRTFVLSPINDQQFRLGLVKEEESFSLVESIRRLLLGIEETKMEAIDASIHTYGEKISTKWFTFVIDKVYELAKNQEYSFTISDDKIAQALAIQSRVKVDVVGRYSTVLRISYADTVPLRAQEVVNALCNAYIDEGLERQTSEAEKSLLFLDEQLEVISEKLKRSESSLEKFKKKNVLIDVSSQAQATMTTLADYETKLTQLDFQLNIVSSLEQYIVSGQDVTNISFDSLQLDTPALGEMVAQLQEKEAQESALLVEYTEFHPEVVKITEQINILKNRIDSSIQGIQQNLLAQKKRIEKVIQKYTKSMQALPQKELQLANLQRSFMVNEKVYSFLLERRAETAVLKASTVSNVTVVDSALLPMGAVKPKRKMIVAVGILLGLALGFGLVLLREFLNDTVKSKEDVERLTHIPVYGVIPLAKGKKIDSIFFEALRALRTNLEFMRSDTAYKTIVVTSTVSGEGKTTIAANLATILAKGGKRVITLDLDKRRAKLSDHFGLKNDKGVSTLLSHRHTLEEVVQHSQEGGVDVIAAGPVPPNPSELIMSDYAKEIIATLREQYDYVILDTPPVGLVTDASILMHRSDVSLLVARSGYSKKEFIRGLDGMVKDHKIEHVGLVFNGVDLQKNYGYGYGYGYKYGGDKYYS